MSYPAHYARRFTLVELLVVLFILAAVAAMTSTVVSQADDHLRFEVTQERLQAIREAIVGRPGRRGVDGFVADMGRLPETLSELLDETGMPPYQTAGGPAPVTSDNGIRFGWRGPYLSALPELGGGVALWDGWGNPLDPSVPGGDLNFGWNVPPHDPLGDFVVQSYGRDGALGADPSSDTYALDYPDSSAPLVSQRDCCVDLSGRGVTVTVRNTHPTADSPARSVQLLLAYPNGQGEFEAHVTGSEALPPLAAGASAPVTFTFPAGAPLWVPQGERTFELVDPLDPTTRIGLATQRPQLVELWARGTVPTSLPEPWDVQ